MNEMIGNPAWVSWFGYSILLQRLQHVWQSDSEHCTKTSLMGNTCGSTGIKISQQVNNESGLYSNNKVLAKSRHAVQLIKQTFPITHITFCTDQLAWNQIFTVFPFPKCNLKKKCNSRIIIFLKRRKNPVI